MILNQLQSGVVRPGTLISKYALSGSSNEMAINGAAIPTDFLIEPSVGKIFIMTKIIVVIQDKKIEFDRFGGIAGSLTNGLELKVQEGGVAERVFGATIKKNADWRNLGYDVDVTSDKIDLLQATLRMFELYSVFELKKSDNDFFKVIVNDDLTNINSMTVTGQGYEEIE